MAGAALFSIATVVLKSIASEIAKPGGAYASQMIQLLCCAEGELHSLRDTVTTIQTGLLDAEKQQWQNEQVKFWLKRLKDVLYDAQDLFDNISTEDLRRQAMVGNEMMKEVRLFFSESNQLAHGFNMANKIRQLRKKLDQIEYDNKFKFEPYQSESTLSIVRRRTTHSFVREEEIIGREEDRGQIIEHLLDSSSRESVSVVSIVGIGGLGKTVLAKLVYNDDKVKDYFELKMWVCHGDPKIFDVDLIIRDILKSAQDECQGDPEMRRNLKHLEYKSKDQLQRLLRKVVDGKKYLLVLDDLWNEDRLRWLELQSLLIGGSWGSKILVTTRNKSVVQATKAKSVIHVLPGLSEDKSWDLFKNMAFGDGEQSVDPTLEKIGRDIVKKCGCVPLAIKTVGSLLYNKNENEWLYLQERELSKIDKLDHDIMEVLKLSYDHLPSWLKHCFAYCALFPKDYVFNKHTMIQLWMAQGFIESMDGNDDLEQIGDSYVSYLLGRSFLEVEWVYPHTGEVTTFKMHDLMHDLALTVAGDECKMFNLNEGIARGIRHASFVSQSFSLHEMTSLLEESNLRTFLFLKRRTSVEALFPNEYHGDLSKFRHCRVLGFRDANFCMPPSLGSQLKHLRFLDVSHNQAIESLPDSITDLFNLQTLNLSSCTQLKTLPRDMRKLVNLRHLIISWCRSLSHMPRGLNHLSSLQTLSIFIVPKMDHKVPGGVGSVDELGELNRLSGSITLRKLEFLQPAPNKCYLGEKRHLHSLELNWSSEQQDDKSESDELILWENLRPHANLAHLTISSCMVRSPPSWLSDIRNLVDLKLSHCKGWKYLPSVSELPSLRELALLSLYALEFVQEISDPTQFNTARLFFPSLEKLHLYDCGKLKGWWGRRQLMGADQDHLQYDSQSSFSKLSFMDISACPLLNSVPLFPCTETLQIDGVNAKLLEQVMAFQNCPSEGAVVSTFIPLSKVKKLDFRGGADLEHSMLETVLQFLGNLEYMSLRNCLKLRSLSGLQYLSSLQHLEFLGCKELDLSSHADEHGTQWRSLVNLRRLVLAQLPQLVALPEGIQHVTTLQYLEVDRCKKLPSLPEWIGNFSLLQELQIYECPSLMCLPDGMRRLTSLKKLRITGCPALEERCQTESGADWEKIAHVPYLSFESRGQWWVYIEEDMSS